MSLPSANEKRAVTAVDGMPPLTPTAIIETTFDFARSCILLAAVELDLFTWIAGGALRLPRLAAQVGADEAALAKLMGALCAMDFLACIEGEYRLTPVAERFLVRGRTTYIGDVVLQIRQEWDVWINLTEVVRSGQSRRRINEGATGGPFFALLAPLLFPIVYPLMRRVCERLGVGTRLRAPRIADLGAGAAPGAIAALELAAEAQAVAIDFAEVLSTARDFAQTRGVETRLTCQAADLEHIELPASTYDIVFAGHIFRLLGAEVTRRLLVQSFRSLRPGGVLVVIETYNDPERANVLFPQIVTLNMLVNTQRGEALASHHMAQWLTEAGFQLETWNTMGPDCIFIARRQEE